MMDRSKSTIERISATQVFLVPSINLEEKRGFQETPISVDFGSETATIILFVHHALHSSLIRKFRN